MEDLNYDLSSLCGPIDERVVEFVQTYRKHRFEPAYLEHVRRYHGGVPGKQYFTASDGNTYRVGRFMTFLDEESELTPPIRPSWQQPGRDIRINWSMLTQIDEEGPTARHLFYGEELLPFAALYCGQHHPDEMGLDDGNVDFVAFHFEKEQSSVVVWLADEAGTEFRRWEAALLKKEDQDEPIRFADFTVMVAPNFTSFLALLRAEP